jgi:hypothetical protein
MKRIFTQVNFNTLDTKFRSAAGALALRHAHRLAAMLGMLVSTAVYAQLPTTIVLSVSNAAPTYVTPNYGGSVLSVLNPVMVTATVTVTATGLPVTSGSVTFYDNVGMPGAIGPDVIGTASIQYHLPATLEPPDATAGAATLPISFGPGPHSLTATYSGTTGGLATAIFPATPNFASSTTVAPTSVNSTGIAASSYSFQITGPGGFPQLGNFNPAYSATAVTGGWAENPGQSASSVNGYGMQIPTGTSTVTDTTTGDVYPLTENSTFSQFNVLYQPVLSYMYQGPGIGPFGTYINEEGLTQVTSFSLADIFQNGVPAMVAVSSAQNEIWVTAPYGNSPYGSNASMFVANAPAQAVAADLNGDGWLDLVVAHNDTSGAGASVGVVLQNFDPITTLGNPLFTAPETVYYLGNPIGNVATGDLNGDGFPDIVAVTSDGSNLIYVLLNDGEGNFTPTGVGFSAGNGASQVALGDFNQDGFLDVAVLNTTDATIGILFGNGDGTFQPMTAYPVGTAPTAFAMADLNVDGYLDFAITNNDSPTQDEVSFLYGQAGGTFNYYANQAMNTIYYPNFNYPETNPHPTAIQATDLNGDGYPDLFIGFNVNQIAWGIYIPSLGQYTYQVAEYADQPNGINVRTVSPGVADLNGDGVKDFLMMTTVNDSFPCSYCATSNNYMYQYTGTMAPTWTGPSEVNGPILGNHNFVSSWVPAPGSIYAPATNVGPITLNIGSSSVSITPSTFNFGSVAPNGSVSQSFTVKNTGATALVPSQPDAVLAGTNPGAFNITYDGCSLQAVGGFGLPPGGTCTIIVTFNPASAGAFSASLSLMNNAGNLPVSATLTGTGSGAAQTTPVINWPTPAPIQYGTPLSAIQLDASSTVAGPFVYSPALSTVLTPGTYTLSVTLNPTDTTDYTSATSTVTLVVTQATLTVTANSAAMTYGAGLPAFSDTITGFVNGDTAPTAVTGAASLTTTATSASAVGTYPITASIGTLASANYMFVFDAGSLTIGKAQLMVTASNVSVPYGSAIPTLPFTITGFQNVDTQLSATTGAPNLTTTATDTSPVGIYPINAAIGTLASNNYGFTFSSGTLSIGQATPVITWHTPAAIRYGKVLTGTQLDATSPVAGSFVYTPALNTLLLPGTYTLSVTLTPTSPDYNTATATVTLVVDEATLRVTAHNHTMTYGGSLPVLTYTITGFVNGDTQATAVTGTPVLSTTAAATSAAGSYPIDVAIGTLAAANYVFDLKDATLKIKPATLIVTTPPVSITYDSPIPTLTYVISGFVNGDTQATAVTGAPVLSTTATSTSPAGSYPIDVTIGTLAAANYVFDLKDGVLKINNATLILATPDVTITYGSPIPALTYTLSGFVNGQTQATATTGTPTVSTTATATSPVGTYPISVGIGTLVAPGYTIQYKSGTLTITKATPLLNWATPAAIPYGTALSPAQLNATASVPGSPFAYAPGAGTVLDAGSHTLNATFTPTDTIDYTTAKISVTLTVTQASQTINFAPLPNPVNYGTAPIPLVATASSGLSVSFNVVSGPATIAGSSLKITGPGSVVVAANQAGNADYSAAPQVTQTIVVYQGSDTIGLTVLATPRKSGQPFTFTAVVTGSGVKPTGTVEFFDGANLIGTANLNPSAVATLATAGLTVGTHNITATYEGNANYPPVTSNAVVVTVTP